MYVRKKLVDKFLEHLENAYSLHCEKHQLLKNREGFITFLIDQDLIPSPQLKRFTICQEFQKLRYAQKKKKKTATIKQIAEVFNISERHIWSILKYDNDLNNRK